MAPKSPFGVSGALAPVFAAVHRRSDGTLLRSELNISDSRFEVHRSSATIAMQLRQIRSTAPPMTGPRMTSHPFNMTPVARRALRLVKLPVALTRRTTILPPIRKILPAPKAIKDRSPDKVCETRPTADPRFIVQSGALNIWAFYEDFSRFHEPPAKRIPLLKNRLNVVLQVSGQDDGRRSEHLRQYRGQICIGQNLPARVAAHDW